MEIDVNGVGGDKAAVITYRFPDGIKDVYEPEIPEENPI